MKTVLAVILGAVLAGIVGYVIWTPRITDLERSYATLQEDSARAAAVAAARREPQKPNFTTITLSKGLKGKCKATIDDKKLWGYRNTKVAWAIEHDEASRCNPLGFWNIELDFKEADFPFDDETVKVGQTFKAFRIKNNSKEMNFTYKVHMNGQLGQSRYELIDPDLEVEPPPDRDAPGTKGASSAVPPPKKP